MLRVWLPLTKDLRQQGLSNTITTNHGTTYQSTSGKLGGCYKTSSSGYLDLGYNGNQINSTSLSFGGWFKFNQSEISSAISGKTYTSSAKAATGNLIGNNSYGGISLQWNSNDIYTSGSFSSMSVQSYLRTSTNGARATSSFTLPFDTWIHIFLTYNKDENILGLWINGELKYTYTQVTFTDAVSRNLVLNYGAIAGGNGPSAYIPFLVNDVRVYDHCLSSMEVKELAKGLVLHYPLNRQGWGQENLHKNSDTLTSTWTVNQGTISSNIATITPTTNSDRRIYQMPANGAWSWQANTKYTASIEAKSTNGAQLVFYPYGGNTSASSAITVTSEWKRYSYSFTTGGSPTTGSMTYSVNQTSGVTLQLRRPKLELGSIATPWCPNSSDALATTMGLNSTTEYDCSGFCNNGSKMTDTITYNSDTAKYAVSTHFNGTYDGIIIENLALKDMINSAITYAFWIKPESESGARSIYFGSYSSISWSVEKTAGNQLRLYWNGSPDETCSGAIITDGVWQHVCITKSGTNDVKVYINGVQKWTSTATHSSLNFPTTYRIGRDTRSNDGTPYKGLMSDFRIYATALSADDVKSLYQNSAYIDSSGNVYGAVHSEV